MKRKIPNVFKASEHGSTCWIMDGRYHIYKQPNGKVAKGKKERFETEANALGRAEEIFNQIFHPKVEVNNIPTEALIDARRGLEVLAKHPGANILKACQVYADILDKQTAGAIQISDATNEWLAYKQREGLKRTSFSNIKARIAAFIECFGHMKLSVIDHNDLHKWLHHIPLSTESKIAYRNTTHAFFQWCIFPKKWITLNPCQGISFKVVEKEVEIFSIEQVKSLWEAAQTADPDIRLFVTLCLFCGLRPDAEAKKVECEDIGDKEIRVHSGKTGRFRYVRLEEGVRRLLTQPLWSGRLIRPTWQRRWDLFRYNLGFRVWVNPLYKAFKPDPNYNKRPRWPHDVMRHTYCSYHLAAFENEAQTAHMAGHKVEVLRKNYRRPIPKSEGEKFWRILTLN